MKKAKIVLIGAGSAAFGLGVLKDAVSRPELRGGTLALVDTNPETLDIVTRVAKRLVKEMEAELTIESSTDRSDVLPGADFVVVSIAVDRAKLWQMDYEIPRKYGIKQVMAESGEPGGLFHTMRNIPMILDICRDMQRLCPDAMLMNFTNPVPRVARAVEKYGNVKHVGLCPGIQVTLPFISRVIGVPEDDLDAKVGGMNHFAWILDLRQKITGEDLYPLLKEKMAAWKDCDQPLTRQLLDIYGLFPYPYDDHIAEFLSYGYEKGIEPHGLLGVLEQDKDGYLAGLKSFADGKISVEEMPSIVGAELERALVIISGIISNSNHYEPAVNIPNRGLIPNLPAEAIVEVPAVISSMGISGVRVGPLPIGIATLLNQQLAIQELAVEAAVTGSRKLALQAILADPTVWSIDAAEKCLDEMLLAQKDYLPQFS